VRDGVRVRDRVSPNRSPFDLESGTVKQMFTFGGIKWNFRCGKLENPQSPHNSRCT